jgi:hypothetical protein
MANGEGEAMKILLDSSAVRRIHVAAEGAIAGGDRESVSGVIQAQFTPAQAEFIEDALGDISFGDLIATALDEWSGEEAAELFEIIEEYLGELDVDIRYEASPSLEAVRSRLEMRGQKP